MKILAIDPGAERSAFVIWDGQIIHEMNIWPNLFLIKALDPENIDIQFAIWPQSPSACVIEEVRSYGMAVGKDIFQTVRWCGRFEQAYGPDYVKYIGRMEVKMHLCHTSRAKDTNIRQALIDRFGPPGTKKAPGLTYGLKKDMWSAFALAVTWWDKVERRE